MKIQKNISVSKAGILRWIGSAGAIILVFLLLRRQGWDEILQALGDMSYQRLLVALFLIIVSRIAVGLRWFALLSEALSNVTVSQSLKLTFAGLFASNFLPTTIGGDVVRLGGALKYRLNGPLVTASLVVDRLIGMIGMLLVLPFGISPLAEWMRMNPGMLFGSRFAGSISSIWFTQQWNKLNQLMIKTIKSLSYWFSHPKSIIKSLGFTSIHMLCIFASISLLFDDIGEPVSFPIVAGLWSFVYLVTLLPISINGYGVQELVMAFIFSSAGGTSFEGGFTIALVTRTLWIIASLPGALFLPAILSDKQIKTTLDE